MKSDGVKNLGTLFLYILTGLGGIALAFFVSGPITKKAFSQSPPTDPNAGAQTQGNPPLPQPPAPPVQSPGVQAVGTQIQTFFPDSKGKSKLVGSPGESKIPDLLVGIIEDYNYNPAGKRDPFTPFERSNNSTTMGPIWPLQKYDLEQLKLVGVIWEVKTPKAMILDPSGHGYVVTVNERIGRNNGYIARIREGEIVVVENILGSDGKASYVTKLMKLNPQ
jgi:type IV pilus assembly protein PilP